MKYRDLIRMYKDGRLENGDREQVEADIERHVAISDYLYESEIPDLDFPVGTDLSGATGKSSDRTMDLPESEAADFTKMIRKTIRRAFLKMGILVGISVLALLLALPHIISLPYYNPTSESKIAEDDGFRPARFEIDMSVYSALYLPRHLVTSASASARGYGNYDISVYSPSDHGIGYNGRIERNRLIMYDDRALRPPAGNCFEWSFGMWDPSEPLSKQIGIRKDTWEDENGDIHQETMEAQSMWGDRKDSAELLQDLDENEEVTAYISFDSILDYRETVKLMDQYEIDSYWMAIYPFEEDVQFTPIGVPSSCPGQRWVYDQETYPYLLGYEMDAESESENAGTWAGGLSVTEAEDVGKTAYQAQILSMLRYLRENDQKGLRRLLEIEDDEISYLSYDRLIEQIEKNGFRIHGVAITSNKAELLRMIEDPAIYSIAAE